MNKIKIDKETEIMFAQAVALSQNGRMKSSIHVNKKNVFILNMDGTILIKFSAKQEFDKPFSFFANDYESRNIRISNEGQIEFEVCNSGNRSIKTCASPNMKYSDIISIWKKHTPDEDRNFTLNRNILNLLDEKLSHIEISKKKEENIRLVQRDIYSGTKIEVEPSYDNIFKDKNIQINTIGIRTIDFLSLFTFKDNITFYIQKNKNWIYFKESNMSGILGTCIYDEIEYLYNPSNSKGER